MYLSNTVSIAEIRHGLTAFVAETTLDGAVYITGSLLGGSAYSPENRAIPLVLAEMLDEGTTQHSKKEIRETLEAIGASIDFSVDTFRIRFVARCRESDVARVLALVAEMLAMPRIPNKELAMTKERLAAESEQLADDTYTQVSIALQKNLYKKSHPNFATGSKELAKRIRAVTRQDVLRYHKRAIGVSEMFIGVGGAITPDHFFKLVKRAFAGWEASDVQPLESETHNITTKSASEHFITLRDKASTDLMFGQRLGITERDSDYERMAFAALILGGTFFARLMHEVREKRGLTYGTNARLVGFAGGMDGFFAVWGTFAQQLLSEGRKALEEQIELFLKKGVTEQEMAAFAETAIGSFAVGLTATTARVGRVLAAFESGRDVVYLDDYPKRIRALTQVQVNDAIARLLAPNGFTMVAAGSVDASGQPL